MINVTKKNISDYAEGVYHLRGNVNNLNKDARETGRGVNEYVFDEMDRGFYKYMPNGNKHEIFEYY